MHRRIMWDDLLYILSVGRAGSLSGAARALRVNHSTVFRRIGLIESQLGVRLFDRRRDGYVPTAAGETAIALADRLDHDVLELERKLAGEDLRPSGTVRVTTTDTLVDTIVPICGEFQRLYPEICIELVTGNEFLNLSRRDADVALRPSKEPPESLHGRRISSIAFAPYGSSAYLASAGGGGLDRAHCWIALDDSLSHLAAHQWVKTNVQSERITFKATSFLAARRACIAGMGVALLPCYMAEGVGELERVAEPLPSVTTDFWLLVHEDIRRTARVRAFIDFAFRELVKLRAVFEATSAR